MRHNTKFESVAGQGCIQIQNRQSITETDQPQVGCILVGNICDFWRMMRHQLNLSLFFHIQNK